MCLRSGKRGGGLLEMIRKEEEGEEIGDGLSGYVRRRWGWPWAQFEVRFCSQGGCWGINGGMAALAGNSRGIRWQGMRGYRRGYYMHELRPDEGRK